MMRLPRVLVFTPIYAAKDYCLDEFIENIQKITYKHYKHIVIDNTDDDGVYFEELKTKFNPLGIDVYHTKRGNSSREALARSQNLARKIFLEGNYDYLMSLESDIFPKPNIIDALVSHNLDIVTALYMIGFEHDDTRTPCITLDWKNKETGTCGSRLIEPEQFIDYINQGVKDVMAGGMGCCLMYRKVVEKVKFTYLPGHNAHSDVFWFNDVKRLGYIVAVDTDILVEHKNSDWTKVADR
jgi:cellulose synthase/poly-beta-1,6-N-acetylglucosamine synthase-like glycosyltransferase